MLKVQMIVSNEFRPDPRVLKEARALVRRGANVSVLGWDRENSGLPRSEIMDGVLIRRVSVIGGRYGAGMLQLVGYFLFYVFALSYLLRNRKNIDLLHVHEADLLPVCTIACWLLKWPMIVDFHEMYSGRQSGLMPRLMGAVERIFLKAADGFLVVNEELARFYQGLLRKGTPLATLPNYPERAHLPSNRSEGPRVVSFFGNVRNAREIATLVDAAARVPGLQVLVAGHGTGAAEVATYVEAKPHARYLGPFSYQEQARLYSQSHIVYAVCALDRNHASAYPVKMWEGLICGQPIIVNKNSAAEPFLLKHNAGAAVTGLDVAELAMVLQGILDNYDEMSACAARVGAVHTWEVAATEMFRVYDEVLERRCRP